MLACRANTTGGFLMAASVSSVSRGTGPAPSGQTSCWRSLASRYHPCSGPERGQLTEHRISEPRPAMTAWSRLPIGRHRSNPGRCPSTPSRSRSAQLAERPMPKTTSRRALPTIPSAATCAINWSCVRPGASGGVNNVLRPFHERGRCGRLLRCAGLRSARVLDAFRLRHVLPSRASQFAPHVAAIADRMPRHQRRGCAPETPPGPGVVAVGQPLHRSPHQSAVPQLPPARPGQPGQPNRPQTGHQSPHGAGVHPFRTQATAGCGSGLQHLSSATASLGRGARLLLLQAEQVQRHPCPLIFPFLPPLKGAQSSGTNSVPVPGTFQGSSEGSRQPWLAPPDRSNPRAVSPVSA